MEGLVRPLTVRSLRAGAAEPLVPGRRRFRGGRLLAVKAAALAAIAAVLPAWRAWTPVARSVVGQECGAALRYPLGWRAAPPAALVVRACELACDIERPAIPASCTGCCVALWRLAWSDFECLGTVAPAQESVAAGRDDHGQVAAAVAAYVGLRSRLEVVGSARLAGRPATMIRGTSARGALALAVAPGPDLVFLLFQAPDERTLRAAWPAWPAMVRAARLVGPEPVAPVLKRPGSLIPLDGDW